MMAQMLSTTPERDTPTVAVIVPAYNRAKTIRRAIQSVLDQTYQDYVIIVVDDASMDDTAAAIAEFADPRVRLVRQTTNGGPAVARNTGIRASTSPLIAFLDSDDEWLPDKLEQQVGLMLDAPQEVGLIHCGYERRVGAQTAIRLPAARGRIYSQLLRGNVLAGGCSTILLRRACLEDVGMFDARLRHAEDYELWLRVAQRYAVDAVPRVLVRIYTDEMNRVTDDLDATERAVVVLAERYGKHLPLLEGRRLLAKQLLHVGISWFRRGERANARRVLQASIRLYPLHVWAWIYAALSRLQPGVYRHVRAVWRSMYHRRTRRR